MIWAFVVECVRRCRNRRWAVLFPVIVLAVSCSDDPADPKNGPPAAVGAIPAQTIFVGDSSAVDASGYFGDPDGDALTYTAAASATDVVSVSVLGSIVVVKGVGQGTAVVTVTAHDSGGLSADQSFDVTVPNRMPEAVGTIADREIEVDSVVAVDVLPHFTDPDGDMLEYSATSSDTTRAKVTVVGSTVTATGASVGRAVVTVTARDPGGLSAEQSFGVTVPNRPPVAVGTIADREIEVDSVVAVDVLPHFTDPDGDMLEYSATSSDTTRAKVTVVGSTVTATGASVGRAVVTVTARDPGGLSAEQSFGVTVPNRPPVAVGTIADREMEVDSVVAVDVLPHFTDPDGDMLEYSATSSDTTRAKVTVVGSTVTATGASVGRAVVTVTARDPGGLSAEQSFGVTVPNRPPVAVDSLPPRYLVAGRRATVDVLGAFADPDGDALTFTAETSDAGVATVSVADSTVLVLLAVAEGEAAVTVAARDAGGLSAEQSFQVSVEANPDRVALAALYEATLGRGWANSTNWLTDAPIGDWFGVSADSLGRITHLSLGSNDLRGPIPPELGTLASLEYLSLVRNSLSGPIPAELGNLAGLESLDLWGNALTGPIPPELGDLAGLQYLQLSGSSLSGPIPPELGNLASLEYLSLHRNSLSGPIPAELGNLAGLERLDLSDNDLTGSIPADLGSLVGLRQLRLSRNDLSGVIPRELGNLAGLESLDLGGNALTGPIPPELGDLAGLQYLQLSGNSLSGVIPRELGNLKSLTSMHLSYNNLTGPIPSELGDLASLGSLYLRGNALTGPIPSELRQLEQLSRLIIEDNDGLCAPGTAVFVAWVEGIQYHSVPYCNESDRVLLASLYRATGGTSWSRTDGWLGSPVLATWYGVSADSLGRVEALELTGNGLSGQLPSDLGGLGRLTELRIGSNGLSGRLPVSLARLSLRTLHYSGTDLCAPPDPDFEDWLRSIPSHDGTGISCVPLSDRDILVAFYEATGGPGWADNNTNWLSDAPIGDWTGVDVDSAGRVTQLFFVRSNNLVGPITPVLGDLASLQRLVLSHNNLTGPIPPELGRLANLRDLSLTSTALTGPIPSELGNLASLRILLLHHNNLTGPIPPELGRLDQLEKLSLGGNSLTGSIPAELGNLVNLESLYLWDNALTGPLPPELGNLVNLESLYLGDSNLTGPLPPELGNLVNLESLYLGDSNLTGPLPPELGNSASLQWLDLSGNNLAGSIPSQLGNLTSLRLLSLSDNALTGPLPPELGNLASLESLSLWDNALTGPLPPELGNLASLESLFLWDNALTGSIPSQLGNLTSLRSLSLNDNALTGAIPPELGNLSSLEVLSLANNNIGGLIPPQLGNLTSLSQLFLDGNALTGPIPPELRNLADLAWLELSHNSGLAGALPAGLVTLGKLQGLMASGTDLCAPRDQAFRAWLLSIQYLRLGRCEDPAMAYLSQAVQSQDFPVPLVAGDEALLRVFLTAARSNEAPIPPVRVTFYRGDAQSYVVDIASKPGPIPTTVQEGALWASANARIPGDVVQSGLEMVVEVDPAGTADPTLGLPDRIPEFGRMELDVQTMPTLDLTLIPFLWTEVPDSAILALVRRMAQDPRHHALLRETRVLLPVGGLDLQAHEPVWTSTNNGYALLSETEAIRVMEGGGGYYMGMMSGPTTGRVAGVASLSGRSSFSRPLAPTMAHELGHNMSLLHAPCGDPLSYLDRSFPYTDGSIGSWGYDFEAYELISPTQPDLMSYCGPEWISDYHFSNALRYRLFNEDVPASHRLRPERVVLLWGGKDAKGNPYLSPAFVTDAPPALPDSAGDYALTGRTAQGREVFSISFTMPEVADAEGASSFAFALPVPPGWEGTLTSISLTGPAGTATLDQDTDRPMAILRDPRTGRVRGILRDVSPEAIGFENLGELSPERDLDVLFSRGIPDSTAWRRR